MAEYKKRKKWKINKKSFRYLPIASVLFVAALLIGMSGFFRVADIVVTGERMYTEDEVIKASYLDIGDNLMFFNETDVSKKISGKLAYAGDVQVVVKYPSTVEILIDESIAIAAVENNGTYWIIDTEGKIVEQTFLSGAADAITVTGIDIVEPKVSEKIKSDNSTKVLYLVDILQSIHDNGADDKITELDITSIANIHFDYDGRFTVNFGEGGESADKFRMLVQVIDEQLEPTAKGTIEIDSEGGVHFIPA